MEQIVNSQTSSLIVDPQIQQARYEKFQKLQAEAMEIDGQYKHQITEMKQELTKKTYDELQKLISEWSVQNSIDMVIGKMEVVHLNSKFDITDTILQVIKEKELYVEFKEAELETEKES